MRGVVQRVARACGRVESRIIGSIDEGFLVLIGVGIDDDPGDADYISDKIANLRVFRDDAGLMNRSLLDTGGAVLLVSQFTLQGDVRKGRRPSFIAAAREDAALPLYERVGANLATLGIEIAYGEFGAEMEVDLVNSGPVTILIDSKRTF